MQATARFNRNLALSFLKVTNLGNFFYREYVLWNIDLVVVVILVIKRFFKFVRFRPGLKRTSIIYPLGKYFRVYEN